MRKALKQLDSFRNQGLQLPFSQLETLSKAIFMKPARSVTMSNPSLACVSCKMYETESKNEK